MKSFIRAVLIDADESFLADRRLSLPHTLLSKQKGGGGNTVQLRSSDGTFCRFPLAYDPMEELPNRLTAQHKLTATPSQLCSVVCCRETKVPTANVAALGVA